MCLGPQNLQAASVPFMSQDFLVLESIRPNMADFKLVLCVVIIYYLKL